MLTQHVLSFALLSLLCSPLLVVGLSGRSAEHERDPEAGEFEFLTNAQRLARGLVPKKPTRTWDNSRPMLARRSVIVPVTETGKIGVYTSGSLQCYLSSTGTCVAAASAQTWTYNYPASLTGPVAIQSSAGTYLAFEGLTPNAVQCPDTCADLMIGLSSTLYPVGPPQGPSNEYETTIFTIDPSTNAVTATWTNPTNSDCSESSPIPIYLNAAPQRPTTPRTLFVTAATCSRAIGSAKVATLGFMLTTT